MLMEVYRLIPEYDGAYEVSSLGNVRTVRTGIIRKITIGKIGYPIVTLSKSCKTKTHNVHSLMASAFLGWTKESGLVCDHANNIRNDNRLENLQLVSHRLNVSKDRKNILGRTGVYLHKKSGKFYAQVYKDGKRKHLGYFATKELARSEYDAQLV